MFLRVFRERLTLVFLALLPLHAGMVTVLTAAIAGPGRAPLPWLALWKEGLLAFIVLLALGEILVKRLRHRFWLEFDAVDACIVLLTIVASLVGLRFDAFLSTRFVYGFRYDLLLPLCFVVLRRASWSDAWKQSALRVLLAVGVIVAVTGMVMLLLPVSALQKLGYSDLHSLYSGGGPLAPFQMIGDTGIRRMQSVMSGPNQLGMWLLVPYAAALSVLLQGGVRTFGDLWSAVRTHPWHAVAFALFDLAIGLTFSRAAWIAACVIVVVCLWSTCDRKAFVRIVAACACVGALVLAGLMAAAPGVLLRATSNAHHVERPLEAVRLIRQHPLGLGLGAAGPATNRLSDTCVQLPDGADASWAKAHPELCVTVGSLQVQPLDRSCTCPLLPENWYLQLGVELGVLGLLLQVLLIGLLLVRLPKAHPVFLALLGVGIAGFFLHSFEDFGVSATLWILLTGLL